MSKSLGNVIDPIAYIEEFGPDALRYYLMAEISIEKDGVFTRESFINVYNNDLANIYGNLVSRFLGMTSKYTNNIVCKANKPFTKPQQAIVDLIKSTIASVHNFIDAYDIKEVLAATKHLACEVNKLIQDAKPWTLFANKETEELNNLLFIVANAIRVITTLLQPILTNATKIICDQMNFKPTDIL
jgi:methionyl-tRNA synthetase